MRLAWLTMCIALVGGIGGCAPPASQGGLDSDNPAAQLYAIRQAGSARDRAAAARLVEYLDSDDPAVRMFAIGALERISGERLGYNPYAPATERQAAIRRWREAVATGRLDAAGGRDEEREDVDTVKAANPAGGA